MRGSSCFISIAFAVILFAWPLLVAAQSAQYTGQILTDNTVASGSALGYSLAISPSGMYLAASSVFDDIQSFSDAGSVTVFARDGTRWNWYAKVTSPDPYPVYFGMGVAISEDWLVVGAPFEGGYYGAIHIFALQNGQYVFKTSFSGPNWESFLGASLALDGNLLLATPRNPSGTVLAYTLYDGNWSYYTTLSGTSSFFWYRNPVLISNSWILTGSYGENNYQGAAYLWPRSGTYIDQYSVSRLSANSPQDNANLGYSAAFISDSVVALGSHGTSSILIFAYTVGVGWSQTNILSVSSTISFGYGLSSSPGKYLLVGDLTTHRLFLYNILSTGLSEPYEIPRPDVASLGGYYGAIVLIQGDDIFVTEQAWTDSYPSGSVFTFTASELPSNARVYRNVNGKSNNLGYSVTAEGGIAAISQPGCSEYSPYDVACGKVYLVETSSNGWRLAQYFQYLGRIPDSFFGTNVLLNNGWLLVTSQALNDPSSGIEKSAVYGFQYTPSTGKYIRKFSLTSPWSQSYQYFGWSLAMDGNFTIISSPYADVNGLVERGRVFVLHYPKSINKVRGPRALEITNPNASDEMGFGQSVAAKNGILVVSTPPSSGRLYVFSYDDIKSATLIQTISAEVVDYTFFGQSIVFDGSNLFATSYQTGYTPALGAVYHFVLDENIQFQQVNRITPYDENLYGYFGVSLAYNEKSNYLVVGASPIQTCLLCTNYEPTSVYVLQNVGGNDWQQTKYSLGAKDGSDTFGLSVATNDAGIVVGAPFYNTNEQNRGAVYFINV